MSSIKNLMTFTLGAAISGAATWYYMRQHYEPIIQDLWEQIDNAKANAPQNDISEEETDEETQTAKVVSGVEASKPNIMEYASMVRNKENFTDYTTKFGGNNRGAKPIIEEDTEVEFDQAVSDKPYVISPEEAGSTGYELIDLVWYSGDNYLVDELDDVVEDVEERVGFESLTHFGEYEEDSVFVRNDKRGIDYEILLDERKWKDIRKTLPPKRPNPMEG